MRQSQLYIEHNLVKDEYDANLCLLKSGMNFNIKTSLTFTYNIALKSHLKLALF